MLFTKLPEGSVTIMQLQIGANALFMAQHHRLEFENLLTHVLNYFNALDNAEMDLLAHQHKVHETECALRQLIGIRAPDEVGDFPAGPPGEL